MASISIQTEEHYILCGVRTLTSLPSNPRRPIIPSKNVRVYRHITNESWHTRQKVSDFTIIRRANYHTQKWTSLPSYSGQTITITKNLMSLLSNPRRPIILSKNVCVYHHTQDKQGLGCFQNQINLKVILLFIYRHIYNFKENLKKFIFKV